MKKSAAIIFILLIATFVFATSTNAAINSNSNRSKTNANINANENKNQESKKLNQEKLKACKGKEKNIQNRNRNSLQAGRTLLLKFNNIAERVETFYENKILASGNTVSNYDDLLADVLAKKSIAEAALEKAESTGQSFNCQGDDPKETLAEFRANILELKLDLKDYKTAVKNLIVAVHSASKNNSANQNKNQNRNTNNLNTNGNQ